MVRETDGQKVRKKNCQKDRWTVWQMDRPTYGQKYGRMNRLTDRQINRITDRYTGIQINSWPDSRRYRYKLSLYDCSDKFQKCQLKLLIIKIWKPGNTNWRETLSTVDLLIKVPCFVKMINNIFSIKMSWSNLRLYFKSCVTLLWMSCEQPRQVYA